VREMGFSDFLRSTDPIPAFVVFLPSTGAHSSLQDARLHQASQDFRFLGKCFFFIVFRFPRGPRALPLRAGSNFLGFFVPALVDTFAIFPLATSKPHPPATRSPSLLSLLIGKSHGYRLSASKTIFFFFLRKSGASRPPFLIEWAVPLPPPSAP